MNATNDSRAGRVATPPTPRTSVRDRSGAPGRRASAAGGYWVRCRGASAASVMVLPLLAAYEGGIAALGGDSGLRAGVDAWIGLLLPDRLGVPDWAPSLTLALALIAWRVAEPGRFRLSWALGACVESVLLGAGLLALFRLSDPWFEVAGSGIPMDSAGGGGPIVPPTPADVVAFLGAGIFEEAVFRLGLLGVLYAALRLLQLPNVPATALAVSGSALAFAMAHHVGEAPGSFHGPIFVFRWLAGVYFAWVYILRGFGIAVGTHVAYDLLVAADPWPA